MAASGHTLYIHDGIGSVELLDSFGSDVTVVNSARVSFSKEVDEFTAKDEKLLAYLARHKHVSPFFHPQLRFRIKMPIFLAREWYRHTVGFSRNEVSRRYVDSEPQLWCPNELRQRGPSVKQGSAEEPIAENDAVCGDIRFYNDTCLTVYKDLLAKGVCPEQARTVLPQSMYTEFIETASLAGYARLCGLRLDPTAQKEIQEYAGMVSRLILEHTDLKASWAALAQSQ